MIPLEQVIGRLAATLDAVGARWALIGGVAVSLRGRPRVTFDIDVALAVADDRGAEALVGAVCANGFRQEGFMLEQEATGRLATVRVELDVADEAPVIDLMFASSGLEPEIVQAAERLELVPGVCVPVATIGHLLALKVLAGRLKDQVDAVGLIPLAGDTELRRAEQALRDIERLGTSRKKDLLGAWTTLVETARRESEDP